METQLLQDKTQQPTDTKTKTLFKLPKTKQAARTKKRNKATSSRTLTFNHSIYFSKNQVAKYHSTSPTIHQHKHQRMNLSLKCLFKKKKTIVNYGNKVKSSK